MNNIYKILVCLFVKCYILRVFYMNISFMLYITCFYMNISFMLIYVVYLTYLTYLTYYCFLMKYDNTYFLPFTNEFYLY